ncbi:uncharacterized protein BO66DRAFT_33506 [Aspergillus aculeatinus CBS 121060]|uniref:Uncharacterized protein n=1 Tax=Aspergillus aculeatinus CBS 121060 TaxID=1448322 RepID=A0ACD1HFI3_9EURO|nr:hypothetical protein BO66DRAFT_33506 [Aspergillus aculeatinus CBS 121060]RAH72349.1 hypothetical protein BO66DRAFT_33506 [Aspergillus aculeatinus CBS 121060]
MKYSVITFRTLTAHRRLRSATGWNCHRELNRGAAGVWNSGSRRGTHPGSQIKPAPCRARSTYGLKMLKVLKVRSDQGAIHCTGGLPCQGALVVLTPQPSRVATPTPPFVDLNRGRWIGIASSSPSTYLGSHL